jgi:hypothetical protein
MEKVRVPYTILGGRLEDAARGQLQRAAGVRGDSVAET